MAPSSSSSASTTSVQVALRIRPPTTQDSTSIPARFQRTVIHATSSNTVGIEATSFNAPNSSGALNTPSTPSSGSAAKKQQFSFDQVHPPHSTQYELFASTAKPLVSRFIEGFNCTILAYGQTSSGKTFTMTGIDLDADPVDPNNGMGIIPRAVSNIFSSTKQLKDERGSAWNYSVKASFIEIYNEDLIDLLSLDDTVGGRREVQIREDKDGHIIWGGLREINVRNASEVMSLLRKGTSIRRTNETDMNAQSSRSHAIFSLTLTQKKYTGSTPLRSSSPLPPNGRSPSRLTRPGSMIGSPPSTSRVASPTFGRPSTPSFAAAMGRGGLRPASALGHTGERSAHGGGDEDHGEWITITSKFHFVDLAGSERLKRTAAAGERIKEGISINSGLLALGNVISALGDPSRSKSNTASHVPYRDSKLTRLLQDSLGGNAHTLMIACVSPAEWNANETLNTLKYANRARNIKNRAVLNEKEDGWDDVEWLQGTVARLRKELRTIKDGGVIAANDTSQDVLEGGSKKLLVQMTELQSNYESLRTRFVERTEELTRLRRELGEKTRISSAGAVTGAAKYEEIVGPVIEEYEKTIVAIEAELSLNRAALRHTNELVVEKEEELAHVTERHAATELYMEELRSRVAKLTERESSTEAYIRDLEEKIKSYDETSISSTESMTDLKREISRFRDAEASTTKYIAELEARLGHSNESILGLQQTVEKLENECERRQDEVKSLQSYLETLRQDGENWRSDLEERERRVKELELKMVEWEKKKKNANDTRIRLGSVVDEVTSAKQSLVDSGSSPQTIDGTPSSSPLVEASTELLFSFAKNHMEPGAPHEMFLDDRFLALQQTHTATLADLSSVTSKYRDALREISDLAAQIQEAKLGNAEMPRSESPDKVVESPPPRRRMTNGRSRDIDPQFNSSGRRLFFRQAASAESLHARSLSQSQSLSQELSSVHSRKTSFSSHGTSSSHSPSSSHSHHTLNYLSGIRPNLSISLPGSSLNNGNERSVNSLEKEIMRLQEVLKEREAEITLLEESLKRSEDAKVGIVNGTTATLSPQTLNQFDHIRMTMENGNGHAHSDIGSEQSGSSAVSEPDEPLERLNELMLSMAQKESNHRQVIEDLNSQLNQVQRQLDDLTALSRDQALNMSTEIEGLRRKHDDDLAKLEKTQKQTVTLMQALEDAEIAHCAEIEELRIQHQTALNAKSSEVDELIDRLKREHGTSITILRNELTTVSAALERSYIDHERSLGALKAERDEELRRRLQEASESLALANSEHDKGIVKLQGEHTELLKQKDVLTNAILQRTEEEYYNALTKLRGDHTAALKEQAAELNASMERLREEHVGEMRMAEIARDGSISESQSAQTLLLQELRAAHTSAIARKEASFAEEIKNLKAEQARTLALKNHDFSLQMDRVRLEYETSLAKLAEDRRVEVDRLNLAMDSSNGKLAAVSLQAQKDLDEAIRTVKEHQAAVLQEVERVHSNELATLKQTQAIALVDVSMDLEEQRAALLKLHAEEITRLNSQHQQGVADISEKLTAEHWDKLKENEELLNEEKSRHAAVLAAIEEKHLLVVETLRSQNQLAISERHQLSQTLATLQDDHRRSTETAKAETLQLVEENDNLAKTLAALQVDHRAAQSQAKLLSVESDRLSKNLVVLQGEHHAKLLEAQSETQLLKEECNHLSESLVGLQDEHRAKFSAVETETRLLVEERDLLFTNLSAAQDDHRSSLQAVQTQLQLLQQENDRLSMSLTNSVKQREQQLELLQADHELVLQELDSHKVAADEYSLVREQTLQLHEREIGQKADTIREIKGQLTTILNERDDLEAEVSKLRTELDKNHGEHSKLIQEASKRESLVGELDRHRSILAEMQENLQKVKDEKDAIQVDKGRVESLVRDLQAQLARSSSPPSSRPIPERNMSYTRSNVLPAMKLPPPTPPPSAPPPPAPIPRPLAAANVDVALSTSSQSSATMSSSSKDSQLDSPLTSVPPNSPPPLDPKIFVKLEQQTKQIDEQEVMIKTLNKQLTHCESDLQTHMDLVSTLETSLGDSEKNLRKARMHATELARERDTLNTKIEALQTELVDAKREVVTVRRSIVEEKHSLEQKLDEERKAKERARQQLDSRMDELQKRKSKFACL